MWPALELPSFITSDNLPWLIVAAIVVLVALALLVANFVRSLALRIALLGVIGLAVLALWVQRAELADCQDTCECRLFGQDVHVPESANPTCSQEG
jgi:hypothetical protein